MRASFYIPGWTVENHLPQCRRIRDAGHEIGAHGNVHEAVAALDQAQEKAVLAEQLRILADHLGVRPAGYRSPSWDVNVWTPGLLKSHGFRYDSSLMGNDVPYDVATPEGPLTEIPVQWIMDDAPLFRHVYGATNAIADPARVLQMWSAEFVAMHRENGCFVLTCHPFISGRASRVALIEELVAYMRRQRGVWFATGEEVARWHENAGELRLPRSGRARDGRGHRHRLRHRLGLPCGRRRVALGDVDERALARPPTAWGPAWPRSRGRARGGLRRRVRRQRPSGTRARHGGRRQRRRLSEQPRPGDDVEEWDRVMETNMRGVFLTCQAAARRMVAANTPGKIITISSGAYHSGREGASHYCASKAGVVMFTKVLAMELAGTAST